MDMFVNEQTAVENYVECYIVTCKTPMKERSRIYKAFKDNEKVVIFNCSVLGEGIDFPCCDGVFLSTGYTSRNRVIQAVGRPLRLFTGKKKAHIYMPTDKNLNTSLLAIASVDPEYEVSKLDSLD
jgi:superfamily II DNA or RNA helicase